MNVFGQACLDEHELNVSSFILFGEYGLSLKKTEMCKDERVTKCKYLCKLRKTCFKNCLNGTQS